MQTSEAAFRQNGQLWLPYRFRQTVLETAVAIGEQTDAPGIMPFSHIEHTVGVSAGTGLCSMDGTD
jgi:hypothetical protein